MSSLTSALSVLLATVGGLRVRVPGLESLPLRVHISSDLERRPVSVLRAVRISRFGCIDLVVRRRVRKESILMLDHAHRTLRVRCLVTFRRGFVVGGGCGGQ